VVRINAESIAAEVVDMQAVWYRTLEAFVIEAMSEDVAANAVSI
jgi:hypothetical protein